MYYICNTQATGGEKLEFKDNLPIYIQIVNYIKSQIASQKLKVGDKLPSVREFSANLKVNPNTIQKSYKELEREGLAYTQRGMGTFITEDPNILKKLQNTMATDLAKAFIRDMRALGFNDKDIIRVISERMEEWKNE